MPTAPFTDVSLDLPDERTGKVRVSYALSGDRRLFVTTDRLSAFDRIIAGVPHKGQVLNQLSAWWFATTGDIVANHALAVPDPNALVGIAATPLPVEVIVRGHITGVTSTALWTRYAEGERVIYGYRFPDGLRKNTPLPAPLVTPTTKAVAGGHDTPLTCADVVDKGYLEADLWSRVHDAALALFDRGREVAARAGLVLADTKYEFGLGPSGELLLIDEVHTPDSSRFWETATYEARLDAGEEPESLDKEVVRRALLDAGYTGDGIPPALPDTVWEATTARYIAAYERITHMPFEPAPYPVAERLASALADCGLR